MSAFFDTSVIVYVYDALSGAKQVRAAALVERHARERTFVVSTQVLQESYVNLVRKRFLEPGLALRVVENLAMGRVMPADAASVLRGLRLSQRHQLSAWDGLIVQAALDAGCTMLYTEDLQAGQRFDDLEVVNPFADVAHEPRRTYRARPTAPRKRPK